MSQVTFHDKPEAKDMLLAAGGCLDLLVAQHQQMQPLSTLDGR